MKNQITKQFNTIFVLFVVLMIFSAAFVVGKAALAITHGNHLPDGTKPPDNCIVVNDLSLAGNETIVAQKMPGTADNIEATLYTTSGTICFVATDGHHPSNGALVWSQTCLALSYVLRFASCLLGLLCVISFHRSYKNDAKPNMRYIKYMSLVGLSIIATSLLDTVHKLIRSIGVHRMFPSSTEPLNLHLDFDVTKLFFGLGVLFLAIVLNNNRKLKEEQELTI